MRRKLPFSKVDDSVDQAVTADMASPESIVLIFTGFLRHVKEPQVRPHWLTLLAYFNEHVPMDFGECVPRNPTSQMEAVTILRNDVLQLALLE